MLCVYYLRDAQMGIIATIANAPGTSFESAESVYATRLSLIVAAGAEITGAIICAQLDKAIPGVRTVINIEALTVTNLEVRAEIVLTRNNHRKQR